MAARSAPEVEHAMYWRRRELGERALAESIREVDPHAVALLVDPEEVAAGD